MLRRFRNPMEEKVHEVADDDLPPAPKKILILDDDEELTGILREYLEGSDFQVAVVQSGVEGVKKVMGESFDLILCDMMMPHMPGDMFYRAVERTRPQMARKFIFMTGHKGDPKVDQFIRSVKGLMLWKPFEMHQLMEAIELVLKKQGAA